MISEALMIPKNVVKDALENIIPAFKKLTVS